jgi:uncharacterized protein
MSLRSLNSGWDTAHDMIPPKSVSPFALLAILCALVLSSALGANAQCVSLTSPGSVYIQDFNTLATSGTTNSLLPAGWFIFESGTSARVNQQYAADNGSSNTGDTYSYGASGSTDRALGTLLSGTIAPTIGACFTNNTGAPITAFTIQYTGKQFRVGTINRTDELDFQYSTTATALNSPANTWTDFSALTYTDAPGTTVGAVAGLTTAVGPQVISSLNIPDGSSFWVRWNDFNASGSDDGLAVDDFKLMVGSGGASTNPSATGAATAVNAGASTTLSGTIIPGTNPDSVSYTVACDLTAVAGSSNFALAASDATFSGSYSVPSNVGANTYSLPCTVVDDQARSGMFNIALTINAPQVPIPQVQGSGIVSPYVGQMVATSGIVTAVTSTGFFLQDPVGDGDPNTSDGIFVYTSSKPTVAAGDSVNVSGKVAEYPVPANAGDPSVTEIDSPSVSKLSSGNTLPAAVTIQPGDLSPSGGFNQLERYEGMRVHVDTLNVVGPTDGTVDEVNAVSTSNGLFYGVLPGTARPFREAGIEAPELPPPGSPCCVPEWDSNPERLLIDTKGVATSTAVDVTTGAVVTDITGPLDLSSNVYSIHTDHTPAFSGNVSATAVPLPDTSKEFTIACFNMERFFDTIDDPTVSDVVLTPQAFANRLNKASLAIRNVLNSPDVIGVEELENIATLQAVADKVNNDAQAATGVNPQYQPYLVEGNDIGGIDVGFLVKSTRVQVNSVTQFGKDTTYTDPTTGQQALLNDRPPLVLDASITNQHVTTRFLVVANHLRSLISVDTDPRVRAKRLAQAEYLANLIQGYQSGDPSAKIVSLGDYNAFNVNDGYVDVMGVIEGHPAAADQDTLAGPAGLVNPTLTDLVYTLDPSQQYSYSETGTAQVLDHLIVNPNMQALLTRFAIARNDADFPETFRNDPNRPERISDHDIPVAYFQLPVDTPPSASSQSQTVNYGLATTFALNASDPDAGQTLTFATTNGPSKGSVSFNGGNAIYTPGFGTTGTDSFTYTATDDAGLSASATVSINIVPVNVSGAIQATNGGWVYNLATHLYVQTITLKNVGTAAIAGPIQMLIGNVPAGVTVANASGIYNGSPYVTANVMALAPGQSTSVYLQLKASSVSGLNPTKTEYSGSF